MQVFYLGLSKDYLFLVHIKKSFVTPHVFVLASLNLLSYCTLLRSGFPWWRFFFVFVFFPVLRCVPPPPLDFIPISVSTLHLIHLYTGAVAFQCITSLPSMASPDPGLLKWE